MKTGIYLIQNIKNGKCYVGQSKNIDKRIKEHKNAMCYKSENSKFNEDLKKYDICDFAFKILELCNVKELNEKEKYYSDLYDSVENGYNFLECGKNKVPSENAENNDKVVDKVNWENMLLKKENKQLKDNWNKLKEDLIKIRQLTFTKYNKNEWENCLSFNDDILPLIEKMKELEGSASNE